MMIEFILVGFLTVGLIIQSIRVDHYKNLSHMNRRQAKFFEDGYERCLNKRAAEMSKRVKENSKND